MQPRFVKFAAESTRLVELPTGAVLASSSSPSSPLGWLNSQQIRSFLHQVRCRVHSAGKATSRHNHVSPHSWTYSMDPPSRRRSGLDRSTVLPLSRVHH